jgi:hypothetical protein
MNCMKNQHFLKESLHLMNNLMHFQSRLMSFPKSNSPITRFKSTLQTMTQTSKQESSNEHHWYTSKEKLQSLPTFAPTYSHRIMKTYFIKQGADQLFQTISQHLTWPSLCTQVENFIKNIATLASITRHKERSMDTYLFQTSNKSLIHGTRLQSTPLDHGSFCSRHILQNQKSLQHFKPLQSLT